jgi:uncharacterized protein YjiS (DUF1127 family)
MSIRTARSGDSQEKTMSHAPESGMAGTTFTLSLATQAVRRLVQFVTTLKNRRAVASLAMLDDRALKDIGLTRNDVSFAMATPLHYDSSMHLAEVAGGRRVMVQPAEAAPRTRSSYRTRHHDAPVVSTRNGQLHHA